VPSCSGTDGSNPIPSSSESGANLTSPPQAAGCIDYRVGGTLLVKPDVLVRQPPRGSRFGSPLVLSRVHWVRPEFVADANFLTRTDDNLLRQVVCEGLRPRSSSAQRLSLIEAGATMPPSQ
jgi:hypothetical protein